MVTTTVPPAALETPESVPTSGTHVQTAIDTYGRWVIIFIVGFIALLWIGSEIRTLKADNVAEAQTRAEQSFAHEQAQVREAARQQRVCGSFGEPACECLGLGTVMRYLGPGQAALVRVPGNISFSPRPAEGRYKLCDPESKDANGDYTVCVSQPGQNLRYGLTIMVVSTSKEMIPLVCGRI